MTTSTHHNVCVFGVYDCGASPFYASGKYWEPVAPDGWMTEAETESHEHGNAGDDPLTHRWAYQIDGAPPGSRDSLWVCCDCHDMLAEFGQVFHYLIRELPI